MNIELAKLVIQELVQKGVRSFCICPGGRLAPFVELLSYVKGLEVLSFFEERSAGFFALGRVKRDQKPIAVLTTSGTATVELLPSVIEAHYNALPLVLVTADRPLEFGKQGAPQTLQEVLPILKNYCRISKNILKPEDVNLSDWQPSEGSLHLNVCFDEPLIDKKIKSLDFSNFKIPKLSIYPPVKMWTAINDKKILKTQNENSHLTNRISKPNDKKLNAEQKLKAESNLVIKKFFQSCKKPLILVGELRPEEQALVKKLFSYYKGLFYIEALSSLGQVPGQLISGERILKFALKTKELDGVIRLGGVPRARFWKDLEKHKIPVLSLSSPPFYSGLCRPSFNLPLLASLDLLKPHLTSLQDTGTSLKELDQIQWQKWKNILNRYPLSEEFWFWTLKTSIKDNSKVFLGNSNPIRLWDMVAFEKNKTLCITGQAGVNGIEGLLSRFLGECSGDKNNVGIVGDLSLLYDMAGFWRAKDLSPWTLVVINNYGGQIFSRLFHNKAFLNQHELSFAPLSDMWGLHYGSYKNPADFCWPETSYNLVEICPCLKETQHCFEQYVSIWNNL